jgi:ADP-heptose:LPS heptosyltransferase
VRVNPEDVKAIRQELLTFGIQPGDPFVVIHPGATAESRRYPPEGYAAAARILRQKSQLPLIFTGSLDEVGLVEGIRALDPEGIYSLAGRLTISQLTALLSETRLLISNNTGPVHLAAGVGTPVVVLYALTNPQHTPWAVASRVLFHDVPCKFCYKSICPQGHHNCLRMVTPAEVAEAAQNLLLEISDTSDRQVETVYES